MAVWRGARLPGAWNPKIGNRDRDPGQRAFLDSWDGCPTVEWPSARVPDNLAMGMHPHFRSPRDPGASLSSLRGAHCAAREASGLLAGRGWGRKGFEETRSQDAGPQGTTDSLRHFSFPF